MSDPHQWVTNPPTTMVKVRGVSSRESFNGALGVVLQYNPERGRYVIHMIMAQEQIALKPENLQKATWWEHGVGQYQLLRYDRNLQRQMQSYAGWIRSRTGMAAEYVAAGVLLVLVLAGYGIGFTRLLLVLTFLLLLATIVAPDLLGTNNTNPETIVRNFPRRYREWIQTNIPVIGPTIAASTPLSTALGILILAFFVRSLWMGGGAPTATTSTTTGRTLGWDVRQTGTTPMTSIPPSLQEHYYKLGFEDATHERPYGTSLTTLAEDDSITATTTGTTSTPNGLFGENSWSYSSSSSSSTRMLDDIMPPASTGPSMGGYLGILMSVGYMIRTIRKIGTDTVTGRFSIRQITQTDLSTLEPVTMILLGLSIYRVMMFLKQHVGGG